VDKEVNKDFRFDSFEDCTDKIMEENDITEEEASALCAQLYYEDTGEWPAEEKLNKSKTELEEIFKNLTLENFDFNNIDCIDENTFKELTSCNEEGESNKSNAVLDKNACVEILLEDLEYQAWEEFDNYMEESPDMEFDCHKVATFLNHGENDDNVLVILNSIEDQLYKADFEYNQETHEIDFKDLKPVEEVFLEKSIDRNLDNITAKSIIKGEYNNPVIDIIMYKNKTGKYPEIKAYPKNKNLMGNILVKNEEDRIVEGPVLIPNEEDHDGDIINKQKIEEVAHEWMLNYRNLDLQHTLNNVAQPVESYITKEDKEVEFRNGETKTIPAGSWIIASYIPDDNTWQAVKNRELNGYSIMGVEQSAMQAIKSGTSNQAVLKNMTLEDLEQAGGDWTVPFVSLVDDPAVPKALYYSIKSNKEDNTDKVEKEQKQDNNKSKSKGFVNTLKNLLGINKQIKPDYIVKMNEQEYTLKEGREFSQQNRAKLEIMLAVMDNLLEDADIEIIEREGDEIVNRFTTEEMVEHLQETNIINDNGGDVNLMDLFNANKNTEKEQVNEDDLISLAERLADEMEDINVADILSTVSDELGVQVEQDYEEDEEDEDENEKSNKEGNEMNEEKVKEIVKNILEEQQNEEENEDEDIEDNNSEKNNEEENNEEVNKENNDNEKNEDEEEKNEEENNEEVNKEEENNEDEEEFVKVPKDEFEKMKDNLEIVKNKFSGTPKSNQPDGQEDDDGEEQQVKKNKRYKNRDRLGRKKR